MEWDIDFELARMHKLLNERLWPGCLEHRLRAEDIESLIMEIRFEGDKVYVEVMKVMCRPHGEGLLRRYLEVHLHGATHLQQRADEMLSKAGEGCVRLLEAFKGVLDGVLNWLGDWQERYFGAVQLAETEEWWTSEKVMQELDISSRTLYSYTRKGVFDCRKFGRGMRYSRESVMRLK